MAAKAGKHEIVVYLLSIPGVSAEGVAAEEVRVSNHGTPVSSVDTFKCTSSRG